MSFVLSSSSFCDTDEEGKFVPVKDQVNTLVYNSHCLPRVRARKV